MNTTNHTSPSAEELKPCPFWGSQHIKKVGYDQTNPGAVRCYTCYAETKSVESWNSRDASGAHANRANPIGEDAANGAIGEREAFENCLNAGTFDVDRVSDFHDFEIEAAWRGWQARAALTAEKVAAEPFQSRVQPWMLECFGAEIAADKIERNHRFFEEATEAVQANGMTRSEAHQLVDYTFDRPVGELHQEIGGVMVTLAALCLASGQDMHAAGETELTRIWTKVEAIRAKQAAKPKHSPLPAAPQPAQTQVALTQERIRKIAEEHFWGGKCTTADDLEKAIVAALCEASLAAQPVSALAKETNNG